MNINIKKVLLYLEVFLLLGPMTLSLSYISVMSLFVGIPSLITSIISASTKLDFYILLAVIGNILGVFAIIILWGFVKATLNGVLYQFTKFFWFAMVAGVLAAGILLFFYKLMVFILVVLPIMIITFHFIYLQKINHT